MILVVIILQLRIARNDITEKLFAVILQAKIASNDALEENLVDFLVRSQLNSSAKIVLDN